MPLLRRGDGGLPRDLTPEDLSGLPVTQGAQGPDVVAILRLVRRLGADLASAQSAFMRGDLKTARQLASRAKTRFPVGSPGWVKADDIATYRPKTKLLGGD